MPSSPKSPRESMSPRRKQPSPKRQVESLESTSAGHKQQSPKRQVAALASVKKPAALAEKPTSVATTWFGRQREAFGLPFLGCICVVYFAQGFKSLSSLSIQFFLKDSLALEPAAVQSLLSAGALPWSLKPVYGLISDSFPIHQQRRKPYLVGAAAIGVGAWVGLSYLATVASTSISTSLLLGLLFFSNLSTALSDVIVDAMVAERSAAAARAAAAAGGDGDAAGTEGENALQSLCWSSLAVGGLTGSGLGMAAASSLSVSSVFLLSAVCPGLVLLASRALSEAPPAEAPTASGLAAVRQQLGQLVSALRTPSIHRPLLFFLLQAALVPSVGQPLLYFLLDELHFSKEFISLQSVFAYVFLLVGSLVYTRFVEGVGFVRLFLGCQLAQAALSLLDVLLVSRRTLGVPDHLFVLGTDALGTVLSRMTMQPFLVIAARLCPEGCEATLYACFMSTYNFGNTLSGAFGAAIIPYFGVEKGHYEGLTSLLLVRSACMLVPLPLIKPLLGGVQPVKLD